MRLLHTSDWHIGNNLYGKNRYNEYEKFLNWMQLTIKEKSIDILLISGDIFDTTNPSNKASELYFDFLYNVAKDGVCKHIVITAGNHDSVSFLEAPKEILKFLNIYVVANIDDITKEVLKLKVGKEEIIICAVPFLRDRELRDVSYGENLQEREEKLIYGIKKHYQDIANYAINLQDSSQKIIAMGHMFVTGENTKVGDGVRELYVGNISNVGVDIFSEAFDYVALGHLHIPQSVSGKEYIRYSGSPLAMGFNEANQQKSITILDIEDKINISTLDVPKFQELEQIKGDLEYIKQRLTQLKNSDKPIWVEIIYEEDTIPGDLNRILNDYIQNSKIEILRIKSKKFTNKSLKRDYDITLQDLSVYEVFDKCLEYYEVDLEQRDELKELYKEVVIALEQKDINNF